MWGDASVPLVDGTRTWTEMIFFGQEPESHLDPFIVSVVPYGVGVMGTDGWNYGSSTPDDSPRLAKYHHAGKAGHDPQLVVRDYSCC